ncbi:MAG: transglutaminase family protein [Coleofasciculus sp. G3-WIS-01]|uniref:transglutaminase family protein n=1 Tax=Coleofasciculus sp. G3-WIS-01 TaxID=3069528 RepID=UPI0032F96236
MRYKICHTTTYTYNQPVILKPHILRLSPRCDGTQKLHSFTLDVEPQPTSISEIIELDGNAIAKLWFNTSTEQLAISATSVVETCRTDPDNIQLEPWATQLPIDYPDYWSSQLQPYQQFYDPLLVDAIKPLAQDIYQQVKGDTVNFVQTLNQHLYSHCKPQYREKGASWSPSKTWQLKRGSCRDLAVLFMDVCRVMGLGARFVSGYQEGNLERSQRYLHAWVEIYLPGAGWQGYDPNQGVVVTDRHIPLVACAIPRYAAPISGAIATTKSVGEGARKIESDMKINLSISRDEYSGFQSDTIHLS